MKNASNGVPAGVTEPSDPIPGLKRQLARAILERFTVSEQNNLARRLGIDQPRASDLQRGRLERFSLQQLVRFAARADGVVTIDVEWTSNRIWIIPRADRPHHSVRASYRLRKPTSAPPTLSRRR